MDSVFSEFQQAHAFIDDILVVIIGTEINHIGYVEKKPERFGQGKQVVETYEMQICSKGVETVGAQNNHHGSKTLGAENGIRRIVKTAPLIAAIKNVHGVYP